MNETDIQQRFHLMQKEIEATATLSKDAKIDLTAAVDSLKIELEVWNGSIPDLAKPIQSSRMKLSKRSIPNG